MNNPLDHTMQQNATTGKNQDLILTRERILEVIQATEENSAARKKACDHFKSFIEFCGIDFDLDFQSLAGSYSPSKPKNSVVVPSDEKLVQI